MREKVSASANVTFLHLSHEGGFNATGQKSDYLNPKTVMASTVKQLDSSQQQESSVNDPYGASQGPKLFNAIYEERAKADGLISQNGLRKGSQSLLHHSNS